MKRKLLTIPLLGALFLCSCIVVDPAGQPAGSGGGYVPPPAAPREQYPPPQEAPPAREWRPAPPAPLLRIAPSRLDFGPVEVDSVAILDARVENRGDADLDLRTIVVDGGEFELQIDGCSGRRLRARRACEFRLRFSPTRAGRFSGTLRLRSNDPGDPFLTVPLTGEGRARREPEIEVRQKQLDFDTIAVGTARLREAQIFNRGQRELRIRAIAVDGRDFSIADDGCSGRPLPPGRECKVVVRFAPQSPGPAAGRLGVISNDPDERQVAIPLAGKGREEDRPRCAAVRLKPFPAADQAAAPLVVKGVLPQGGCVTYMLRVERRGRLKVCVPPGYSLTGGGLAIPRKGGKECRFPGDPVVYRRYLRNDIDAGTDITDLTLSRQDDARKEFKLHFEFRAADGARDAATEEDD